MEKAQPNHNSNLSRAPSSKTPIFSSKANLSGMSNVVETDLNEKKIFENTYKIEPDKKFKTEIIKTLISELLGKHLTSVTYSAEKIPELTKLISNEVLAAVKALGFPRYKFVVDCAICEAKGQGVRVASRCVWNPSTDGCASAYFKSGTLFAVASVFGCFYE